jgi:uncharacterized protein (TIGR03437 family)
MRPHHATGLLLIGLAGCVMAQAQDGSTLRGSYRFVHLTYSDGPKLEAASQGGTLSFDGAGVAQWGETAARYEVSGPYEARLSAGATQLALRFNQDGGVLIGSSGEVGRKHHLLVAVRAGEGISQQAVRGNYGVAAFILRGAEPAGLATAYAQMTADGAGQFSRVALLGHAASIDDVNRREERMGLTYELRSDGTGVAHLGSGSDVLNGDHSIAISADGSILLGWSAEPSQPGILLGVRKPAEVAAFSFRGRFWLTEMFAENSFAFQQSTRFASARGSLASNMAGVAYFSQQILAGGETTYLATANQYRVGSDGMSTIGPKMEPGADNFAFNETAFVAAQTGAAGQLSLGHGIVFGIAAPPLLATLSSAASPQTPDAPVVPGALMSIAGNVGDTSNLRVRVGASDAELGQAAPDRIPFRVPVALEGSGPLRIELLASGKVTHVFSADRSASSPALYAADSAPAHADGSAVTTAKPAEPGETIVLTVTGLGSAPTLRVLLDGLAGEVSSTTPIDEQPGRFRIHFVVPREISIQPGGVREVPIALVTPDSFNDLADLPVRRPPGQ